MTDQEQTELDQVGAIALTHTALLGAMLTMFQEKGLVDADDINQMLDDAAHSLEKAETKVKTPQAIRRARQVLEETARNLLRR